MNLEQFESTDAAQDCTEDAPDARTPETRAGGPGKPPEGRRFAKGVSGNPNGRPKRVTGAKGDRLPGADEPTRRVILAEAYRMVTVKDGDTELTMPAHAAVFRALTELALNGSHIAQRRWTAIVREAEAEQKREQIAIYNLLEVEGLEHELSYFHGRRMPVKSYADDILVDGKTGVAVVRGEE
jgi:hypothetical protein